MKIPYSGEGFCLEELSIDDLLILINYEDLLYGESSFLIPDYIRETIEKEQILFEPLTEELLEEQRSNLENYRELVGSSGIPPSQDAEEFLTANIAVIKTDNGVIEKSFGDAKTKQDVVKSLECGDVISFSSSKLPNDQENLENSFRKTLLEIYRIQEESKPLIQKLSAIDIKNIADADKREIQKLAGHEVYLKSLTEYAQVHALYALIIKGQEDNVNSVYPEHAGLLGKQIYGEVDPDLFLYAVSMYLGGRMNDENRYDISRLLQEILGNEDISKYQENLDSYALYNESADKRILERRCEGIFHALCGIEFESYSEGIISKIFSIQEKLDRSSNHSMSPKELSTFLKKSISGRNEALLDETSLSAIVERIREESSYHMNRWLTENGNDLSEDDKSLLEQIPLNILIDILNSDPSELEHFYQDFESSGEINYQRNITGWEITDAYCKLLESMGCGVKVIVSDGENSIYTSEGIYNQNITLNIKPDKTSFRASSANLTLDVPAGNDKSIQSSIELFMHEFMAHIAGTFRAELGGAPILGAGNAAENEGLAVALQKALEDFLRNGEVDVFDLNNIAVDFQNYLDNITNQENFSLPPTGGLQYIIAIGLLDQGKSFIETWNIMRRVCFIDKKLTCSDDDLSKQKADSSALNIMMRVTRCNAVRNLDNSRIYTIPKDLVYYLGKRNLQNLHNWLRGKVGDKHNIYQKIFGHSNNVPYLQVLRTSINSAFQCG